MSQAGVISFTGSIPSIPTSFMTDSGSAVPVANVLQIVGSGGIVTSGLTNVVTVDGSNVLSNLTLTGNSGGAISPVADNFNFLTANSTFTFSGASPTLTLDFNKTNMAFGTTMPALTSGTNNYIFGDLGSGASINSGAANVLIGGLCGSSITSATNNVYIGVGTAAASTTSSQNIGIGASTLSSMSTGTGRNTAVGHSSLSGLQTGNDNICLGFSSGTSYVTSESSNICIGSNGTASDSNVLRIGRGLGSGVLISSSFISGITGVTVAASAPVGVSSSSQLSSLGFGTASQVLTSNGAGASPTWQTPTFGTVTSVSGTAGRITSTGGATPVIDIDATYVGQNSITTLGTVTTGTWNGSVVSEVYGGTNQSTYTTGDILYSSAANTLSKRAIGTSGQVLTVSAGVPVWSTPTSGTVTGVSGTAGRITSTGGATPVIDIDATYVGQSSITTLGTVTTGIWNSNVIPLAYGGTNANLTASNGGIFYSTATAGAVLSGTATAGQILRSGSSSTPSWSTATYPATAGTSGNVLTSDGTNFVSSAPAASGQFILISTQTASASASIDFTSLTAYNTYLLVCRKVKPATNGASLRMRVSSDNGSTWKTTGYEAGLNYSAYNTATLTNSNSTTYAPLSSGITNGDYYAGTLWISHLNDSIPFALQGHGVWFASTSITTHGTVGALAAASINAVQLLMSSGNITTGVFSLYGVKET